MTHAAKSTQTITPSIYVACLASYNAGILHGRWIKANQDAEHIMDDISDILSESPEPLAEEWAIHDYEGFGGLNLSEYESIEHIAELAMLIEEHGELATHVVAYVGGLNYLQEARSMLDERYCGLFDSAEDWAWDYLESTGLLNEVPESLRYYVNAQAFARDCELSGDIVTIETTDHQVHVFHGH